MEKTQILVLVCYFKDWGFKSYCFSDSGDLRCVINVIPNQTDINKKKENEEETS